MRIAIVGCAHGELDRIYKKCRDSGKKVDLILCCGDFQSVRNKQDLRCMAVPDKFKNKGSFYKYYSGEAVAPVLTIFIGGNHEASNYLQELAYGGWVAPNIYYLGYASVINIAGVRIGGISGIYNKQDACRNQSFMKGHYEYPPYNQGTMRSAYYTRRLEVFRLKQLSGKLDIFLSHDWPSEITNHGDLNKLLKMKPFFKEDISKKQLGSPLLDEVMKKLYPSKWFAAHLHCKFEATVYNEDKTKTTKFMSLDKCGDFCVGNRRSYRSPRVKERDYFEFIDIEHDQSLPLTISYDIEWLTILFLTNNLLSVKDAWCYLPESQNFTPTEEQKEMILEKFNNDLSVPQNFQQTVRPFHHTEYPTGFAQPPMLFINRQTTAFCEKLGIDDPFDLIKRSQSNLAHLNRFSSDQTKGNSSTGSIVDISTAYSNISLVLPLPQNQTKNSPKEHVNSNKSDVKHANLSDGNQNAINLGFFIDTTPSSSRCTEKRVREVLPEQKENCTDRNDLITKKFKRKNEALHKSDNSSVSL
ncbi:hypothetical protein TKK_0015033 [Trichogramma kaykai]|uniref:Lariat debranching enzyme C-terminal domain-containing protein n=1 Tax=Trichogramma kaykai TaxID=54128 RepID=A0ABD2WC92_9HYME